MGLEMTDRAMSGDKGKVFLFGSESIGQDENMGFEIFVTLLDALASRGEPIKAVIFWNTAVNLLAGDSPLRGRLKALEEKGVDVVAGRFCVQDLCIADQIVVGRVATMDDILDLLLHNEVISL
jgi:hypothetical protein